MNCPKCDLPVLPDQKFCRACGVSLQVITQPLAEYAALSDRERTPAFNFKAEQRTNRLLPWGFIIMFIGVGIGVIGKMLMHQEIVTVIGVLASLVGMFLTAYPYLSNSPRRKQDSNPSSQPEFREPLQPTKDLPNESNTAYVPSITERTTNLLKEPTPARMGKEHDGESQA